MCVSASASVCRVCRVFVIPGNGNYGCLVPEYIENKLAATARQKRQKTLANWHRYRDIECNPPHTSPFPFPLTGPIPCPFPLPINPRFKMQNQSKSISVAKTFANIAYIEDLADPWNTYSTLSRPINQITAFCLLSLWFWLCAYATKLSTSSWYCNFVQKSLTEIQRIYHKYAHINQLTSKIWIILPYQEPH